ncbi:hypothetical protein Agub_g10825 [Astrephomene gubernaculifera]|uniref:Uncharacterized protein n=1 Tax=Astrephomene gubernaculifera TaxID=47775 RepID=A0AAD3DY20_9CHLO|nr:hypothetical protein Agub_g10825 [Astrephomene gubernaculifera]
MRPWPGNLLLVPLIPPSPAPPSFPCPLVSSAVQHLLQGVQLLQQEAAAAGLDTAVQSRPWPPSSLISGAMASVMASRGCRTATTRRCLRRWWRLAAAAGAALDRERKRTLLRPKAGKAAVLCRLT